MVLYGYDASVFNSVQGSSNWKAWFNHPNSSVIGSVNTAYTVGAIVGGFFFGGPIADYLGRKMGMALGCILVIIATFMQTFAPHNSIGCFLAGRCIIGIGQGIALSKHYHPRDWDNVQDEFNRLTIDIAAGPIYIGELSPPEIRGKIMTLWQTFYSVGSFICFWVNYGCTKHTAHLGEWDWKMVVMFQLLVPVIILILLPTIPGTPRWYIQRQKDVDKARMALRSVREIEEEVEEELIQIRGALEYEKEAISSNYSALWKDRSIRYRLLLALVINAGQQLTGQGSLNSYSTIIYEKVFTSSSQIALINALNATCGILFTLNAIWIVDRFGRKILLIIGGIGMGICMIIVAAVETETPDLADGAKTQSVGIALVFLLFLFILFCEFSSSHFLKKITKLGRRQTFLGRNGLDLDIRSILNERSSPSCRNGFTDPECRKYHFPTILPHIFGTQRLLRVLFLRWH